MKLNCDMGESFGKYTLGNDFNVMPSIHMANIACGFHAGDAGVMEETVKAAVANHVEIGAHPGFPDLQGFGRRNMDVSPDETRQYIIYQAGALDAFCRVHGSHLSYIKPHGAMYNSMMVNDDLMGGIMQGATQYGSGVKLMIQATPNWEHHQKMAENFGVELLWEAFADRSYEDNGSLRNRKYDDALLTEEQIVDRVTVLVKHGTITSITGKTLSFPIDALCVHGDSPAGVKQIKQIRELLDQSC